MKNILIIPNTFSFDSFYNYEEKLWKRIGSIDGIKIKYNKKPSTFITINSEDSYYVYGYNYTLSCELPKNTYNNYTFIGIIKYEPENDDSIIYATEDKYKEQLEKYIGIKKLDYFCNHCNIKRPRVEMIVFLSPDNQVVMFGTSCVNEYFGVDVLSDIEKVLKWFVPFSSYSNNTSFSTQIFSQIAYYKLKKDNEYKNSHQRYPTVEWVYKLYKKPIDDLKRIKAIDFAVKNNFNMNNFLSFWKDNRFKSDLYKSIWININNTKINRGLLVYGVWVYITSSVKPLVVKQNVPFVVRTRTRTKKTKSLIKEKG